MTLQQQAQAQAFEWLTQKIGNKNFRLTQLNLLMSVYCQPGQSHSALAKRLDMTVQGVHHSCNSMREAGLMEGLKLTAKGEQLMEGFAVVMAGGAKQLAELRLQSAINTDEREALYKRNLDEAKRANRRTYLDVYAASSAISTRTAIEM